MSDNTTTEPPRIGDAALERLAEQPVLGAEAAAERLRWVEAERDRLAKRVAELEQHLDSCVAQRNAANDARDVTQRVLDGIDGVLAQRTAERDEARRRSCLDRARAERSDNPSLALINHSRIIAKRRGWDCFDKKEERCPG